VLLETKLQAPRVRQEWVPRPGLIRALDDCESKLILVDAPAGYGKTTLLAQWGDAAAASRPFAWVSLDRGDDDPARLWQHVICSLQRALPSLRAGEILRPLQRQVPDAEEALARLVNELASLAAPVVVILDDYHVIRERRCHEQLEFLLLRLPPSAQVVLSTRADPPLPLGRLRAAGELAEIRVLDLHFTEEEAAVLIQQVASVRLSQRALADLLERTEGWPAGLYLAALSLRNHPAPQDFIRDFTGGHRYVVDFLAEEVISRQPDHIRRFLSRTAVLGRFTAPLCDAVAGTSDAREVLDVLERENMFLIALDDNREWFRYHHLFAELQLAQLARAEPGTIPALHRQASAWHLEHGSIDEAAGHALAAGDVATSVRLMAEHWYRYVDAGRAATVHGWLRSLGDDGVRAHPLAAHCAAWVAALRGDREGVRRWLPVIAAGGNEGPLPDGMRSLRSSAALLDGSFGLSGLEPMRRSASAAVELETNPASPWYALARAGYGGVLYFCGEFQAAARQLEQALLQGSSIALVRMLSFAMMSLVALEEGRLDQAEQLAHSARDVVLDDAPGLSESPQASLAAIAVGAVLAGQGRFEDARSELERALRSRRQWFGISQWPTIENLLRLAPVRLELGDLPGALALLDEAREILTSFPDGAGAQLNRLERLERRLAGLPRARPAAEPLTEREQAVLRLLRGTLSTRQIGQELYLSGNTIKTHTRSIYRKLGVSTRPDAVQRGRELGLYLGPPPCTRAAALPPGARREVGRGGVHEVACGVGEPLVALPGVHAQQRERLVHAEVEALG
jgi:LuxR family transcriptional regulator, maltose regulon positive regulatory protein